MSEKKNKLTKTGYILSSLGGLLVIYNFTREKNAEYGLILSVLAVVLALGGIYLIEKGKKIDAK